MDLSKVLLDKFHMINISFRENEILQTIFILQLENIGTVTKEALMP